MEINRLKDHFTYIGGAMDNAPDGGVTWRDWITPKLNDMGIRVMNPCAKPTAEGIEDVEVRNRINALKEAGEYDTIREIGFDIRQSDLRMVDKSDFVIIYLDMDIPTCGTWEELFTANKLKRPTLVVIKQGKKKCPNWLLWTLPHEHIFSNFDTLLSYLSVVNSSEDFNDKHGRWCFFDYSRF